MSSSRNMLLSFVVRAIVCGVLLSISAAIFLFLYSTRPETATSDLEITIPRIIVMPAEQAIVARQWDGFGTARAMDSADVPARVTATVVHIPPGTLEGASVSSGELLVQLDDSDFLRQVEIAKQTIADLEAQLARFDIEQRSAAQRVELAQEQVELARREFDRVENAAEKGAAQPREVDQSRQSLITAVTAETRAREELDQIPLRRQSTNAQKAAQEASLKLAEQNVQRCRIASPLDGVLESVDVEVGESVQNGQRVARVVSLDRIEAPLLLPSSARGDISIGDSVVLRSTGAMPTQWNAGVARLSPNDDELTRTFTAFVVVDDESAPAPGTFLSGSVESQRHAPQWIVPRRAIQEDRIFLVEDGTVVSRRVDVAYSVRGRFPQFGLPDVQWAVLDTELPVGAQIVVTPSKSVRDGLKVIPVSSVDASTASSGAVRPSP